jgi:CBS domain-containing protein
MTMICETYKNKVAQSQNPVQLRHLRENFQQVLTTEFHRDDLPVIYALNQVFDSMIRQVVVFVENKLANDLGLGRPPVAYAFVLFGSGGRSEQMMGSDQDNGLIYETVEDPAKSLEVDIYFEHFAAYLTTYLMELGFAECSGRVLCKEERWRKSEKRWYSQLLTWLQDPTWEYVRYLLVFADGRTIFGEPQLYERLRQKYYQYVRENPNILSAMLRNTLHRKVLIGLFGNLIKEPFGEAQGGIDVKYGAYVPFVNAIRLLSIRYHIATASTLERIRKLYENGHIDRQLCEKWENAFAVIIGLRASTYMNEDSMLFVSDGKLKADQLHKENIASLKESMRIAKHLQNYTRKLIARDSGGSTTWI